MPKQRLREIDNTGTVSSPETPNIVYIPGPASSAKKPVLFTNINDFKKALTDNTYDNGLSAKMAYHLLTLGMYVLYEGVLTQSGAGTPVDLSNSVAINSSNKFTIDGVEFTIAADKTTVSYKKGSATETKNISPADGVYTATISTGVISNLKNDKLSFDFITSEVYYIKTYTPDGQPTSDTWDTVWSNLEDKNLYNVRFLTTGQFMAGETCGLDMITCAAKRCDAVALLDFATANNDNAVTTYRAKAEAVVSASKSLSLDSTKDPSTFAAAYAPTWKGNVNTKDGLEAIEHLPPAFAYLCAYARSVKENPMWYAVAGSFRGNIPELISVDKEYGNADIEILQARSKTSEVALDANGDNVGVAINPIAYRRPFGHIIWGNRTLRDNPADEVSGVGKLKATSFMNCRILATEVAKVSYEAANKYTFEQNNEVLWTNFTSYILPTLDRMSTGNGILDYKIVKVATDKKARLCAKISLIPIEAVEDFDITVEMTDSITVSE